VPEQPDRLLERRVFGQLGEGKAADDQFAALAIYVAEFGRRGHDAIESLAVHDLNVVLVYDRVNIDSTINMKPAGAWMTAGEAAAALRVGRATLYAYVSRGLVRSQPTPGPNRERAYSREDVERLRRRTEERRDPDRAAGRALQWGLPVLESSITMIAGGTLYYRGHDALVLARSRSFREVASLIWTGGFDALPPTAPAPPGARTRELIRDLPFAARAQVLLATASADDTRAADLRPRQAVATGWRILGLMTAAAIRSSSGTRDADESLARDWHVPARGVELLRSALILCADHELNVSSFAARCVASAESNPYAVVSAGLAALEGPKHGGASARVDSMLVALRRGGNLRHALSARLRRGEAVSGFGHPLYPAGDPRAKLLLELLRSRYPRSSETAFVLEVAEAAASVIREQPNLDFALAGIARVLRLPPDAGLTLFAIGRTVGWIGHAIEQYATGELIRPRARYVGVVPAQ
jgi:citrate synthase